MGAKDVVVVDGAVLVDGIVEVVSCAAVVVVAIETIGTIDVDVEEVGPLSAVQPDITSDAPKAAMTYDR